MPATIKKISSKKKKSSHTKKISSISSLNSKKNTASQHVVFLPLLFLCGLMWFVYRMLFNFPTFFDETVGKLVFFGLPVWLYIVITQDKKIIKTIRKLNLLPGLYVGLLLGGIYGFIGLVASLTQATEVQVAYLFLSPSFWWEFFLAILTGFWESLFFFGWIMTVAEQRWKNWKPWRVLSFVILVFVLFHIPNTLLRFKFIFVWRQVVLLTFFALGQALLFYKYRNIYALTLSHTIWGMVLLIYGK